MEKLHAERLQALAIATEQERCRISAEQEALLVKEQLAQAQQELEVVVFIFLACVSIFLFGCLRSGGCSKTDRRTEEGERGEAAIGAAAVGPPDAFRRRNRKSGKVAIEIGEFDVDEGQPEFV